MNNLKNIFVYSLVLKKYNRKWGTNFRQSDIFFLLGIHICASKSPTGVTKLSDVSKYLKICLHTMSANTISYKLGNFVQEGLVKKTVFKHYAPKYNVTWKGKNVLVLLTKEIRKIRFDRQTCLNHSKHKILK